MAIRRNQIAALKARQLEEAQECGVNPYQDATGSVKTEVHRHLAHYQQAMQADIISLKALNTLDEKQAAKAVMLDKYLPFVGDYIDQGHNYPNDIAVQTMIWLIDTGDIEKGLNLALHLIAQEQVMPPRFDRRDIETFLCDALYDWANLLLKAEQSASPYLDILATHIQDEQWPVHPLVAGKVYVMLAKHKLRVDDFRACVTLCELAEQVNPEGAGVKTMKAQALAKLRQEEQ